MGISVEESKNKTDENKGGKKSKMSPPTKIIIRRLPPSITEPELMEQLAPLPQYDHFRFVPADMSLHPWAYSKAYCNLLNVEDVLLFRDRFDGYVLLDNKGNEYPVIVEFAPSQKVPQKKTKKDPKCGTINNDPDFKEFLAQLNNPKPIEISSLTTTLAEIEKREKELKDNHGILKVKTPLVEFIEWRKEEKLRRREEKRRQKEEERQRHEEERRRRIEREKFEAQKKKQKIKEQKLKEQKAKERQQHQEKEKEKDQAPPPPSAAASSNTKNPPKEKEPKEKPKGKGRNYKDKPSMPLYQPGQRRKQLVEAAEKPLVFKDVNE